MTESYVGEIRMFGGNFAPQNWAFCKGQLLSISDNTVLFQLIGTTYGGDGQNTFGLPNLQSRVPIHMGSSSGGSYVIGQLGGTETVTLTASQLPVHTHTLNATDQSPVLSPANALPAVATSTQTGIKTYNNSPPALVAMAPTTGTPTGGNQQHPNIQPYLTVNFIISLYGIFPPQN